MNIKFTARHFRPRQSLKAHAMDEVRKLGRYYDGIVSANIILSYERASNSLKVAEINLHVYGTTLSASVKSDEYAKSITAAVEKLSLRLNKYKSKLRAKDKTRVRAIHDKV